MPYMAKRKKPVRRGKPAVPNRTGTPLHVWIDPEIAEALQGFLASADPRISKTAAVESALREFLRPRGFWPPPAPPPAAD